MVDSADELSAARHRQDPPGNRDQHQGVLAGQRVRFAIATQWVARLSEVKRHVDNAPSNAICRKLGFELLEAREFEFPKRHFITCNDWRLACSPS
jgi:hypothetical protein